MTDKTNSIAAQFIATAAECLRIGRPQIEAMVECRENLVRRFGFEPNAAANMTRLIFAAAAEQVGLSSPYTAAEIDTIAAKAAA